MMMQRQTAGSSVIISSCGQPMSDTPSRANRHCPASHSMRQISREVPSLNIRKVAVKLSHATLQALCLPCNVYHVVTTLLFFALPMTEKSFRC